MYGQILRKLREARGRVQAEVARKADMSAPQLARLERDQRRLSVEDFVRIAEVLGEKPGNLLPNDLGNIGHLKPLIDRLAGLQPQFLSRVEAIVEKIVLLTHDAMTSTRVEAATQNGEDGVRKRLSAKTIAELDRLLEGAAAARQKSARSRFAGVISPDKGIELLGSADGALRDIPRNAAQKGAMGAFKAAGTGMRDVGVRDGDVLYVRADSHPPSGGLVIATVNGRLAVKIVERDGRGRVVRLISKNTSRPPIEIRPDDKVKFYFVVVGIWTGMESQLERRAR